MFGPEARFATEQTKVTKNLVVRAAGELSAALGHVPHDNTPQRGRVAR